MVNIANGEGMGSVRGKLNAVPISVYLDTVNGNDANSGRSPTLPVATVSRANQIIRDGDYLFVARNSIIYNGDFSTKRQITVRPYRDGRRPIFTACRDIPSEAWENVTGEIWKATVTHLAVTANSTGEKMQFALWVDEGQTWDAGEHVGLRRVSDTGTLADALSGLERGQFVVRNVGAPDADPTTNVGVTEVEYYVRLKDGTAPNAETTLERTVRYGEAVGCASFGLGSDVEGIDFLRSSNKDHVGGGAGQDPGGVGRFHDCRFIDFHIHGSVARCNNYTDCYFEGNGARQVAFSGQALHMYRAPANDGYTPRAVIDRCVWKHVSGAIGVHGAGGDSLPSGWTHETWELGDLTMYDVTLAIGGISMSSLDMRIKKLHIYGGQTGISGSAAHLNGPSAGSVIIDDFVFVARPIGAGSGGDTISLFDRNVWIKRGWIYIDQTSDLGASTRAMVGVSALSVGSQIKLENVTAFGAIFAPQASVSENFKLTMTNCIMNDMGVRPMTNSAITGGMIEATNTQLAMGFNTLEQIQAKFSGIDSTCVVPFHKNSLSWAVAAGDLAGDPAYVNVDFFPSMTCTMLATASTTTTAADDLIIVDEDRHFAVGQWFQLSGLRFGNGWYQVAEKLGTTARGKVVRVHRKIPWRQFPGGNGLRYQTIADSNGAVGPTATILWPPTVEPAFNVPAVEGTITYNAGGSQAFTNQRSGLSGRINPSTIDGGGSTNYINSVSGLIPWRIRASADDVIDLTAIVYIEEFAPKFAGAWPYDWVPMLRADSELARRGMGWKSMRLDIGVTA